MEEEFVTDRAAFLRSLREAEADEAKAAEKLQADAHAAEMALGEATEQSRRAHTADSIHARAQEELRCRDVEAKRKEELATEAEAMAVRAKQALDRSMAALKAEKEAAEAKASEANSANSQLLQTAAKESAAAATLSTLEMQTMHNQAWSAHPYASAIAAHPQAAAAYFGAGYGYGFPGGLNRY